MHSVLNASIRNLMVFIAFFIFLFIYSFLFMFFLFFFVLVKKKHFIMIMGCINHTM